MSYCRWSSDDFQSDVYVYEHVAGGWMTHVAKYRVLFAEPLPPPATDDDDDWDWTRSSIVDEMLKRAKWEPLGLTHDGETFNDATPAECADRLEVLRSEGYRVPQNAIDALRAEALEAAP